MGRSLGNFHLRLASHGKYVWVILLPNLESNSTPYLDVLHQISNTILCYIVGLHKKP